MRGIRRIVAIAAALEMAWPVGVAEDRASAAAPVVAGEVTIYRDSFGVPHIVGETREAMAFGAGYSLALDRLFETDVIRRLGQGRLSEILGPSFLEADRVMRREFFDAADIERQYRLLPAEVRSLLEAFADGMNLALAQQTANPAEMSVLFPALGYVPEPWRPQDSVTVLMIFTMVAFAGEGAGGEAANAELLAALVDEHGGDREAALEVWQDLLLRDDPAAPAVVPPGEGPPPQFISASEPAPEQIALALDEPRAFAVTAEAETAMLATLRRVVEQLPVPRIGSYGLAATGARTASGKGLLLGAPQAGFLAPSVFYEMGLHAPGIDCTGFTVPGLGPFIGIGWCNGHAWTFVAGNAGDQVDLYVETLCGDGRSYLFEGQCRPMERRREVYLVKSTLPQPAPPQVVTDTIFSTVHGPVFRFDEEAGRAFVFKRAQAGMFARSFHGLVGLNAGTSLDEVRASLASVTATYNALYADGDGHIAYWFTGFQPVRHPRVDHRLPTPGTGAFEWQGRSLDPDSMPHVVDPAGGILHVNQGIDSKPIEWWPRASGTFVGRVGHTAADQAFFAGASDLDVEALERANRELISDRDLITPRLDALIRKARPDPAEADDPALEEAFALYEDWAARGWPRRDDDGDGRLDHPAVTIFGADYLNVPRSPLWDRFVARVWSGTGHEPPTSFIGRLGQTVALIEDPQLFSHPWGAGWQRKLRAALSETLAELSERFGGAPMSEWRVEAPTTPFTAVGVLAPPPLKVVDHGSYSQIVDLGAGVGENILPPGNGRADRAADVLRHALTGEFPPHFTDQVELYETFAFKPMKMRPEEYTADPESVVTLVYPGRS